MGESNKKRSTRILAISSGGGHWVQLLRLRPAWQDFDVTYATAHASYVQDLEEEGRPLPPFHVFPEASRWSKFGLLRQLFAITWILLRVRPDVVVTTGASAGYFALRVAKYLGSRTVWVDSIANAEELSLAGQRVRPYADLWLTQWPHLAANGDGGEPSPQYLGAVL